jgi:hypothetical protein
VTLGEGAFSDLAVIGVWSRSFTPLVPLLDVVIWWSGLISGFDDEER